jgi:hypothetical protein
MVVDLPWSTCPITTRLMCGFPDISTRDRILLANI